MAGRLTDQVLAEPGSVGEDPQGVAERLIAVHAQVMAAAETAIALRTQSLTRREVAQACSEGRLIKTFGPRGTIHLVSAGTYPYLMQALAQVPRTPSSGIPPEARLSPEQADETAEAIGEVLKDQELTIDEMTPALVARLGSWAGDLVFPAWHGMWPRWRQLVGRASHEGVMCFGAPRGRLTTYTNPQRWLPAMRWPEGEESLRWLVECFLRLHSPATVEGFANWLGGAPLGWTREVLALYPDCETVSFEGTKAIVHPQASCRTAATAPSGVHLLPYFDPYSYRVGNPSVERMYPGRARDRIVPGNHQTVVKDGQVVGLFHVKRSGKRMDLTVELVREDSKRLREEIDHASVRLGEVNGSAVRMAFGPVTSKGVS
ncbi:hypothetical protein CGZ98_03670 [Enemella evansiae]|nr:hypothetical protein CGZ98_03670 [Enemella evansiae]